VAEVVNLRLARKARTRAGKAAEAEANRARFGESKAAKEVRRAEQQRTARQLDGARIERDEP
jgi:hypothetical protein